MLSRSTINQSATWSDGAFEATEFLFADYRDFVFPPQLHQTFARQAADSGTVLGRAIARAARITGGPKPRFNCAESAGGAKVPLQTLLADSPFSTTTTR
jgi:hypothetical protein